MRLLNTEGDVYGVGLAIQTFSEISIPRFVYSPRSIVNSSHRR